MCRSAMPHSTSASPGAGRQDEGLPAGGDAGQGPEREINDDDHLPDDADVAAGVAPRLARQGEAKLSNPRDPGGQRTPEQLRLRRNPLIPVAARLGVPLPRTRTWRQCRLPRGTTSTVPSISSPGSYRRRPLTSRSPPRRATLIVASAMAQGTRSGRTVITYSPLKRGPLAKSTWTTMSHLRLSLSALTLCLASSGMRNVA